MKRWATATHHFKPVLNSHVSNHHSQVMIAHGIVAVSHVGVATIPTMKRLQKSMTWWCLWQCRYHKANLWYPCYRWWNYDHLRSLHDFTQHIHMLQVENQSKHHSTKVNILAEKGKKNLQVNTHLTPWSYQAQMPYYRFFHYTTNKRKLSVGTCSDDSYNIKVQIYNLFLIWQAKFITFL